MMLRLWVAGLHACLAFNNDAVTQTNWAGNYTFAAPSIQRPTSVAEVRDIVARAAKVRVVGARHSFSDIADSSELMSLADLPADFVMGPAASTVSFGAGLTYGNLTKLLDREGLALRNLPSLPHVTVAGAVATGTHGSGNRNQGLASSVAGMELVTSSGDIVRSARGDADFDGLVVGLGALGAVVRLTLDVEPTYMVRQRVFESLDWDVLGRHFDEITSAGYSVSLFTRWGRLVDQVWVKSRVVGPPEVELSDLFGAVPATVDRHPIPGMDAINATAQLGRPGPWWDRLTHFRMGFLASSGEELQSEYFVARQHGVEAIAAVRALAEKIRPLLQISEIRTIAADQLWLSPAYGRDTVALHFTWDRLQPDVESVLVDLEAALAPFQARPHWGKLFHIDVSPLYERLPAFRSLFERLDPRGAFRNAWLERHILR
jgi:xylitol oxidase